LKNLPTTWDDTKFLDGDPDGFTVVARRKGNLWYVCGINTGTPHVLSLDLSFIKPGTYSTIYYHDDLALQHVATNGIAVNTTAPYGMTLPANGGFGFILDESQICTPQNLAFPAIADRKYNDPDFTVSATASSGLPVSFYLLSGPALVSGNAVHLTG